MMSAKILNSLEKLEEAQLKKFQWRLTNDHECMSKCEMENADRLKTVDKLVACFGPEEAVKITVNVLRNINQNDLANRLEENEHKQGCQIKEEMMENMCLNLVLLGRSGVGKSSTGNTILGREAFTSKTISTSLTQAVDVEVGDVSGFPVRVFDTPGFSNDEHGIHEEVLQKFESSLCAFLLVLRADRFNQEDQRIVEKIEELLGEKNKEKTWLIFTREDELEEGKTINTVIDENEALKKLVQMYEYRFQVLNNKDRHRCGGQVKSFMNALLQQNIRTLPQKGPKRIYTNIQDIPVSKRLSRRIVLLGKTGVGKSASGNTILRKKVFESKNGINSVTCKSSEKHATVLGKKVSVIDTPGFFDTQMEPAQFMIEIARSVYLSCPGPHAFLIVFPMNNRFTDQESEIPQIIEMLFGEEVLKYSMILFTHEDQIKEKCSVEKLIHDNENLRYLVDQCGGRYHVFNNTDENNIEQVKYLLQKIDTMIQQNGGGYYNNEMFEDAMRFRQEIEIERAKKETEENIRTKIQKENYVRQQNEKRRLKEIEIEIKKIEETFEINCCEMERIKMKEMKRNQEEKLRQEELEKMREEIEKRNQEEKLRQEELEKMREEIEKRNQEEKLRQEELEKMRKEIEERNQEEKLRQEELEKMREEIENKNRQIEAQRSEIETLEMQKENTPDSRNSGFKKFFSKCWKYFLKGIACVSIIGGAIADGVIGRVVALIADRN